jgi:hypothetical protein
MRLEVLYMGGGPEPFRAYLLMRVTRWQHMKFDGLEVAKINHKSKKSENPSIFVFTRTIIGLKIKYRLTSTNFDKVITEVLEKERYSEIRIPTPPIKVWNILENSFACVDNSV